MITIKDIEGNAVTLILKYVSHVYYHSSGTQFVIHMVGGGEHGGYVVSGKYYKQFMDALSERRCQLFMGGVPE